MQGLFALVGGIDVMQTTLEAVLWTWCIKTGLSHWTKASTGKEVRQRSCLVPLDQATGGAVKCFLLMREGPWSNGMNTRNIVSSQNRSTVYALKSVQKYLVVVHAPSSIGTHKSSTLYLRHTTIFATNPYLKASQLLQRRKTDSIIHSRMPQNVMADPYSWEALLQGCLSDYEFDSDDFEQYGRDRSSNTNGSDYDVSL
jgi:hypothetical protein